MCPISPELVFGSRSMKWTTSSPSFAWCVVRGAKEKREKKMVGKKSKKQEAHFSLPVSHANLAVLFTVTSTGHKERGTTLSLE